MPRMTRGTAAAAHAPRGDLGLDGRPFASWGRRVGGWLIDACLTLSVGFGIGTLVAAVGVAGGTAESVAGVLIVATWLLNTTVLVGITRGQSVGKLVGGMRIVHDGGRPARYGTGFARDGICRMMYLIPLAFLLDSLWPLGEGRQTIRDKIVSTRVVQEPSYRDRASVLAVAAAVSVAVLVALVFVSPDSWGGDGGSTYSSLDRDVFVDGCTGEGNRASSCRCIYAYVSARVPHDHYVKADATEDLDKWPRDVRRAMRAAIQRC
jgi:uncharacterized RDD family membrane protein YckC